MLTAGLAVPARAAIAAPHIPGRGTLAFTVWRNGSRIGTHSVVFSPAGDTLAVRTHAHFSVGIGPLALFTYTYDVTETWAGGVLTAISARTDHNGTPASCTARRTGGQLVVDGSKSGRYTAPAGSIAGTHWNKAELDAPMIDPENGTLMRYSVAPKGQGAPPGGGTPASHYALTGFATLDLWYDDSGTWAGLRALAKDKSVVEYHAA
jgi:hypothetical protein